MEESNESTSDGCSIGWKRFFFLSFFSVSPNDRKKRTEKIVQPPRIRRQLIFSATEPSLEEKTAAQWLSETLEQVTGATFPIRAAGKDDASDAKPNKIRVR